MHTFTSTGIVWGKLWGGGEGGYDACKLGPYHTKEELMTEAQSRLEDCTLDGGMGYESLMGAVLKIADTETKMIKGKAFSHDEIEYVEILTKKRLSDETLEFIYSNI